VKAISVEEGPWVMAVRRPAIQAIAQMRVDKGLLGRWVGCVIDLHGGTKAHYQKLLTAEAAQTLKEMCSLAVKKRLGVFACFYG
jgi:hypothetical protein